MNSKKNANRWHYFFPPVSYFIEDNDTTSQMEAAHDIEKELLFLRYARQTATDVEKEQVERWIAGSPALAEELQTVRDTLDLRRRIGEMESYDIAAGYQRVGRILRRANRRKRFVSSLSRVAAILAFPLLLSTFSLGYIAWKDKTAREAEEICYAEIVAAPGTVLRFELPDKSRVWLNANTMLRYPNRFTGAAREVHVDGEAYFEVESDKEHPFYVSTEGGMKVMAYGTQFSVNTEKQRIETVLAQGKVALFDRQHKLQDLKPGEQFSYDRQSGQYGVKEVNLLEKLAWKDGKIIFRNAPLHEVFERLSRRYNVDIILHDDHRQSGRYLSRVTFTDETIQQIFTYLELAAPITWKLSTPVQNNDSTLVRQRIDVWLKKR